MGRRDAPLALAPATLSDYRELARRRLPRPFFDYIDGGANEEATLRENVTAFAALRLRQRVLRDVSQIDLATEVLGQAMTMPVVLAPVGFGGAFARRAEVSAARAAEAAGVPFCESTVSICPIEEVRAATQAPFWYQLYVMRDRAYTRDLMQRARAAGCPVLVLTVDLPMPGARHRDTRNGIAAPIRGAAKLKQTWDMLSHPRWLYDVAIRGKPLVFGNLTKAVPGARNPGAFRQWVDSQFDPTVTWKDIAWIRENWPGKIVLKGILDADDAREAVAAGVDGIVVSNHGGRQLDSVSASVAALPSIVEAVDGRLDVLMDGGVRGGLDVVKALALGAKAVMIGRPWAWAVAARGQDGVAHILDILRREMELAMALTGVSRVSDLDPSVLVDAPQVDTRVRV